MVLCLLFVMFAAILNLTLTLHQKNSCLNVKGAFLLVDSKSLPSIINKEVVAQFIYKPTWSTEKLFTIKKIGNLLL